MRRLQLIIMTIVVSFYSLGFGLAGIASADLKGDACAGLNQVDSSQGCSTNGSGVNKLARTAVEIISFIAGAVAVIMVILAGFKYMTSDGDSNKVGSAKSTLVYALVGIAVATLAQVIVHFALSQANAVG